MTKAELLTKIFTEAGLPISVDEKTTGVYIQVGAKGTWIDWIRAETPLATPLESIPEIAMMIEVTLTRHGYKVKRHECNFHVLER